MSSSERTLDQLAVERLINRMRIQTQQHKATKTLAMNDAALSTKEEAIARLSHVGFFKFQITL